jgi:thioredoxin reductase (NADPH)
MEDLGTKFEYRTVPTSITRKPNGKLDVVLTNSLTGADKLVEFDTVLYAVGRVADVKQLGLEHTGVHVAENGKHEDVNALRWFDAAASSPLATSVSAGKIPVVNEQTNVPHIYAVGDVCEGKLELTPVAVQAGELLARRLYANSSVQMDYDLVPTTVFTPFEYGSVGLSEETAIQRYGPENIETYLFEFTTLELQAAHRVKHNRLGEEEDLDHVCLSKLVCLKTEDERVLGFHFVGPNAGEVTQGFALALRLGAKKRDFDTLVGIHPTDAESFCAMSITRYVDLTWP